ncbi:hypothetical protein QQS21_003906 [Conoideocrella luteorostrata]|uniref:Uncharacterized protein n=1 Tax=Conoideocrella luteorostrata TaxID=1105319 RepID=A0AAJ0CUU2_9HYPO|nr:hypothetical protein QQS21_003906 [Conoideocrella luteorostrata]
MARDNGPPGVRCTSCTTSDNNGDHVDGVVCSEWGPLLPNSHAPHAPSLATRPPVPVILCFVLNILLETGLYLITIALNQILEENICQSITPDVRGADDPRCKGSIVQSELSLIRGWQVTFDIVPGLLTAVPYGLLADRHDKEFVLGLSVLGGALASSFSVLVSTVLGSQLIASPLVYLLIEINKWLPIYCGLGCMWLATSLVFSVPRVPQYQATRKATQLEHCPLPVRAVTVTVRETVIGIGQAAMWFAHNNTVVVMLLLTFLVTSLGRLAQEVLLQFVTKRYGWSWSEVSFFFLFIHSFSPSGQDVRTQKETQLT